MAAIWSKMTRSQRSKAAVEGVASGQTFTQIACAYSTTKGAVAGLVCRIKKTSPYLISSAVSAEKRRKARERNLNVAKPAIVALPRVGLGGPLGQLKKVALYPVAASAPITTTGPRRMLDLEVGQCRWPVQGPSLDGHWFCAASCEKSTPYCEAHAEMSRSKYQPSIIKQRLKRKARSHG